MNILLEIEGRPVVPAGRRQTPTRMVFRYPGGLEAIGTKAGSDGVDEWHWRLRNTGSQRSPAITRFCPLFMKLPCRGRRAPMLHGSRGGLDESLFPPSAWTQWQKTLPTEGLPWPPIVAASAGGRSSNDHLPFFILEDIDRRGGWAFGIGWSGDWRLELRRSGESCELRAGMTKLGLRLEPGETFLQPTILMARYRGDAAAGQRFLRRYLRDRVQPTLAGRPLQPVAFWDNYYGDRGAFSEQDFLDEMPLLAKAGFEYMVLDGGWTGGGQDAQFASLLPHIGSWRPDPVRFPQGFLRLRDAAARHGMKMGLWFDIEQAHGDSLGVREQAALFSEKTSAQGTRLLRLDREDALDWAFAAVSRNVREMDARWLRMDFNLDPAPFWEAVDLPERRGATECRHVENVYRLYDRIRAAFPNIAIENCASGGRRIDLETIRRSHTDWIGDHTQSEAIVRYHIHGAARWLPANHVSTSMAHAFLEPHRPVNWRRPLPAAAYLSHFGGNFSVSDRLKPLAPSARLALRRVLDLFHETRDCFAGDVFPIGHQEETLDGPAGLAAVDPVGGRRAVVLFGIELRGASSLAPAGFKTLISRKPIFGGKGTDQFPSAYLWRDPTR